MVADGAGRGCVELGCPGGLRPGTPAGQCAPSQWPGLASSVCVGLRGQGLSLTWSLNPDVKDRPGVPGDTSQVSGKRKEDMAPVGFWNDQAPEKGSPASARGWTRERALQNWWLGGPRARD